MGLIFPSAEWLEALETKLNSDERYAEVAKKWEGDINFAFDPEESNGDSEEVYYMDLWHGKCRGVKVVNLTEEAFPEATFTLSATRTRYVDVLTGKLDPIQAMATRRLKVKGNLAYLLRNIPVVLDFVRCASSLELDT
jgi:putative sterol carrier protein